MQPDSYLATLQNTPATSGLENLRSRFVAIVIPLIYFLTHTLNWIAPKVT